MEVNPDLIGAKLPHISHKAIMVKIAETKFKLSKLFKISRITIPNVIDMEKVRFKKRLIVKIRAKKSVMRKMDNWKKVAEVILSG